MHEPITKIVINKLDMKLGQFMQVELDSVLRKTLNRKAAWLDKIPPEVWKTREFDDILQDDQDQQCSTTQPHWTQKWENTSEEPKWHSEKSINDIANSRCSCKNTLKQQYYSSTSLQTQREDGANTSRLRTPQRNRRSHNDAI